MTITRVGSNEKYAEGWELAFGKGKKASKKPAGSSKATAKVANGSKKAKTAAAKASAPKKKAKKAAAKK